MTMKICLRGGNLTNISTLRKMREIVKDVSQELGIIVESILRHISVVHPTMRLCYVQGSSRFRTSTAVISFQRSQWKGSLAWTETLALWTTPFTTWSITFTTSSRALGVTSVLSGRGTARIWSKRTPPWMGLWPWRSHFCQEQTSMWYLCPKMSLTKKELFTRQICSQPTLLRRPQIGAILSFMSRRGIQRGTSSFIRMLNRKQIYLQGK